MTATEAALVLARGLGSRMQTPDLRAPLTEDQRRAADAGMKAMMPIGGRPFLDYVLSAAADGGVRRVAIVVAPDHEALRRHYRETAVPERIAVDFVVQAAPLGTANAVLAAEAWTDGAPCLVMNGDNLYSADVLRTMTALEEPGLPGFHRDALVESSNIEEARLRAFALVEADNRGYLTRIVEKPDEAAVERAGPHAMVSMNLWRFDSRIFSACRDVPRSPRGEFELPAAVALAMDRGAAFRVLPSSAGVLDLSQRADAVELCRRLSAAVARP